MDSTVTSDSKGTKIGLSCHLCLKIQQECGHLNLIQHARFAFNKKWHKKMTQTPAFTVFSKMTPASFEEKLFKS